MFLFFHFLLIVLIVDVRKERTSEQVPAISHFVETRNAEYRNDLTVGLKLKLKYVLIFENLFIPTYIMLLSREFLCKNTA